MPSDRGSSRVSLASIGDTGGGTGRPSSADRIEEGREPQAAVVSPSRPGGPRRRRRLTTRSLAGTLGRHGVGAAPAEPLQLPRSMGIGVDRDEAPERNGQTQQVLGWVLSFGTRVDLHRGAGAGTGGEDGLRIEGGLRAPFAGACRRPVQCPRDARCADSRWRRASAWSWRGRPSAPGEGRWPPPRRALASKLSSWSSRPSSRMSTSMPVRRCGTGAISSFKAPNTRSSRWRRRSASSPWATVKRVLWPSVGTR